MKLLEILKKIINEPVTLELKNGVNIHGVLKKVDKKLNFFIENAKRTHGDMDSIYLRGIKIRGNSIKYVILPNWINIDSILYEFRK